MTYYNYLCEMQQLCFRAKEALKVLKNFGMLKFYSAAENCFYKAINSLPVYKASQNVNLKQIDAYACVKCFVEEKETEAAYQLINVGGLA